MGSSEARVPTQGRCMVGAVCGVAAGTVALASAQVGGAVTPGALPPLQVLGDFVVRITPVSVTEALIRQVGRDDKLVLLISVLVVAAAAAAGVGVAFARGRIRVAMAGIVVVGLLPVVATRDEVTVSPGRELLVLIPSALLGAVVLWVLGRPLLGRPDPSAAGTTRSAMAGPSGRGREVRVAKRLAADRMREMQALQGMYRRQLLKAVIVVAGSAVVGTALVRRFSEPSRALMIRLRATLPATRVFLAPLTDEFASRGASPLVTSNAAFYRIDTALDLPQVDPDSWSLTVSRDGKALTTYSYDDLLAKANHEADITIGCVSNEIGGDLIGTARWQGVLLADLLAESGVTSAGRISGVSVDGFVASFRAQAAFDGRPSMVAIGMNGQVLPVKHGFPARLVVPGLYGYTSATKWLQRIDVSDSTDLPGFWADRGWTPTVTVHVTSRIDSPRDNTAVRGGSVQLAGIAWAPVTGVGSVDVQIDGGRWQPAQLSSAIVGTLWRQWLLTTKLSPGTHNAQVRATDVSGKEQDTARRDVYPSGATGLHQISFTVT
jgi:DMSO/TMAO reductase YedYZ molybdopterin-dependent catalytic subunit